MKQLDQIYRKNKESGAYIIEIKVNHVQDLFNDLDPSPLRRRDLDQDFLNYLDESSLDIPLKYPLELEITLIKQNIESGNEKKIIQGLRSYYDFVQTNLRRKMSRRLQESLIYLSISLVLLFLSFYFNRILDKSYLSKIMIEGFNIGGWVFFWEFLALTVFKHKSEKKDLKNLIRLKNSEIKLINFKQNYD